MHLFIFGLGYSSLAIAKCAMAKGFTVSGTTRSEEKAAKLRAMGIKVLCHPGEGRDPRQSTNETHGMDPGLRRDDSITHILSSVPPQETGDIVLPLISVSSPLWLSYLSTTGVYGDWGGEWVDEDSGLRPNNERLKRRVAAEKLWLARGGNVFRLSGIYGPGRSAIDDIRAGTARRIDKPGQLFSRTHVEDIAQTVVASMLAPHPGSIYNVCDDEPAPSHEVVAYGCKLLGVEPPPLIPFAQAELSPMGLEFYAANRRVANDKIKRELGVVLRYPTYREGLAQCLQSSRSE